MICMSENLIAHVIRSAPNPDFPDAVVLTVDCPWCTKTHTHGAESVRPDGCYGHRVTHCVSGQGRGYEIVDDRPGR